MTDTILHLKSKSLYHEPLQDPKTFYYQDISIVTTRYPKADSPITTELLIEKQKNDEQFRAMAAKFYKPDIPKTSILHN